VKSNWTGQ